MFFFVSLITLFIRRRQTDPHRGILAFFPTISINRLAKDEGTRQRSSLYISQAKTFDCLSLAQLVALIPKPFLFFMGYRRVALVFGIYQTLSAVIRTSFR